MSENTVRVWDPLVRLFHWSLVAAFAIAWLSGEEESLVHVYAGYFIIGLLVFRVLWGFVGSRYARFGDFIRSPRRTLQYLRSLRAGTPEHFLGHNPAGGWMIVLLLVSLTVTSYTGLKVYGTEGHGPLAAGAGTITLVSPALAEDDDDDDDRPASVPAGAVAGDKEGAEDGEDEEGEDFWEELHEFFANFTVFLIVVHIAGVIVASRLHGENLVRAMITGRKQQR